MVDRGDWSEDVDAGSQAAGDEFGGEGIGFFAGRGGGEHEALSVIGGVLSRAGIRYPIEVRIGKSNSMT